MRSFLLPLLCLLALSCSHQLAFQGRKPQSLNDLFDNISLVEKEITDERIFNEASCSNYLANLLNEINDLPSNYFYPKNDADRVLMKEQGLKKYRDLVKLKVNLQKRFATFTKPSSECVKMQRRSLRYIRYITDSIIDYIMVNNKLPSSEFLFSDVGGQTIVEPQALIDVKDKRFIPRTGDLILMRGQTFVSSMIARNADEETGFAHLGIIAEDPNGNKYLIEALIETGVIITPFDEWMKVGREARLVAYRHNDPEIARKAGRMIYDYSKKRLEKDGIIPYDFTMNPDDHTQIFCAELIQVAFELSTNNALILPSYKSSFTKLIDNQFMKDIGVTGSTSFSPGDIELEKDFTPVAEYRYFPSLRKIKVQDAMLSSMFNWMEKYQYDFTPNPKAYLLSEMAWMVRQLGFAKKSMQKHMKAETLGVLIKFQDVTKVIEKDFFRFDEEFFKKNEYYLNYNDLLNEMDNYRRIDCEFYNIEQSRFDESLNVKRSKFHHYFKSSKSECY